MTTISIVFFVLTAAVSIVKLLAEQKKLPKDIQVWLDKIGADKILAYITEAERLTNLSGSARKQWVVDELKEHAKTTLKLDIPDWIAHIIVEWVFQTVLKQPGV